MKGYTVFNAEQIEGLPPHFYAERTPPTPTCSASPRADVLRAPAPTSGTAAPAYYLWPRLCADAAVRVLPRRRKLLRHAGARADPLDAHEKRLDRDFGRKRWGDDGYAARSCAELGAAFLCADLGDHARGARRSLVLSRNLAQSAEKRQAPHFHRRRTRATRRRLSARVAAADRISPGAKCGNGNRRLEGSSVRRGNNSRREGQLFQDVVVISRHKSRDRSG